MAVGTALIAWLLPANSSAQTYRLRHPPNRLPRYFITGPSRQNLLISARQRLFRTPQQLPPLGRRRQLRILGLRVSFQPDTLPSTTGTGQFDLARNDTTVIDPPPHDRDYFLAQMAGAAHYFRTVSGGKLILTGDVFPVQNDASYRLPHTMDYYHPSGAPEEERNRRLAELFRDAIVTADQTDAPPFDQFDIFVVFHAGVGQDFGDELDPTPDDIPSAFLNVSFLRKYVDGWGPDGIQTQHGGVREGLILPETQNQNGQEFALKGTFCLLLGNQLGLPSLYNPETGRAGIGAWGLMDAGASNYFGLIPAEPCAWSKVFLGWEDPVVLSPGTSIPVAVRRARTAPHIYKIPISRDEYFLIENRSTDFNGDGATTGKDQFGHRLEFSPRGNFTAELDTAAGERLGVITQVEDYDFGIPGSGILVWRVNERVIRENYFADAVNADLAARGVALLEADGSQDIGQSYGFLSPGSGSEYGVAEDAFYAGNEVHKTANRSDEVALTPFTAPSSRSSTGANTGIVLRRFSKIDTVMKFDYENTLAAANFPRRFLPVDSIRLAPAVLASGQEGEQVIVFSPGDSLLYAWFADGRPVVPERAFLISRWDGRTDTLRAAVFDTSGPGFCTAPVVLDADGDGRENEFAVGVGGGRILFYRPEPDPGRPGYGRRLWETSVPVRRLMNVNGMLLAASGKLLSGVRPDGRVLWQKEFPAAIADFCGFSGGGGAAAALLLEDGTAVLLDASGNVLAQRPALEETDDPLAAAAGFLRGKDAPELVVLGRKRLAVLDAALSPLPGSPVALDAAPVSRPALADIDRDGFGEILFATAGDLRVYKWNGVLCSGFPAALPRAAPASEFWNASPLVVLDGENRARILVRDGANNVMLADGGGERLRSYYLSGSGRAYAPFLLAAENRSQPVLVSVSPDGFLRVRKFGAISWNPDGSWRAPRASVKNDAFLRTPPPGAVQTPAELMPYAYNYPNPTRGTRTAFRFYLAEDAAVTIAIYDLTGEKVDQLRAAGVGKMENEISWPLQKVSNGVYLARVQARAAGKTAVKIVKVAVVK